MKKKSLSFILLVIFVLLQGRCLFGQTLLVAAASSMKDALKEVANEFEKSTGHRADFSFGSSGLLAHEIEAGVPYDVYVAAGGNFIQELYHRKLLVQGTSRIICKGKLVIITRKDSVVKIDRLRDIARFQLIAIANPQHAPYGVAAREALQNAGVWLGLQNRILYTERVMDVLELVETGKVPAGIGAQSLKVSAQVNYTPVENKLYAPPEVHIAIVKGTVQRDLAQTFIDFLVSDRGRAILKEHGFLVPGEF